MKTNSRKIVLFLVSALILVGAGVFLGIIFVGGAGRIATDDAYIEGRVHSIAAKIPGTVKKVRVEDNRVVGKGDLLVEIDAVDYELKVNEDRAAVDAEKARLLDVQAGIKTAAAALQIQEVTLSQAIRDMRRAQALYKEGVYPREKYEKAQTACHLAHAQVKAAKDQLDKARVAKKLQESVIRQKDAAVKISESNLGYVRITAPSGGYITRKAVEDGNQIQAGQPLMALVALDDIWIIANYKETQLKDVRPGQKVLIKVDSYPGRIFTGHVDSIMAGTGSAFSLFPPENALGNYVKVVQRVPVKIVFDKGADDDNLLRIGMSCVPTIITKHE